MAWPSSRCSVRSVSLAPTSSPVLMDYINFHCGEPASPPAQRRRGLHLLLDDEGRHQRAQGRRREAFLVPGGRPSGVGEPARLVSSSSTATGTLGTHSCTFVRAHVVHPSRHHLDKLGHELFELLIEHPLD